MNFARKQEKLQLNNLSINKLPNLKCFSLKCYPEINEYDNKILPLLRRMSYLEKLTLYFRIENRDRFIDGTHLQNEILVDMPRLHSFNFYFSTHHNSADLFHHVSSQDIQRTFTNIGQQHVTSIVNYIYADHV
ncbi:unnamed protein product, partial [Rotaria sp. Silwood2]